MNTNSNNECQMTSQQFVTLEITSGQSGSDTGKERRKDSKLKKNIIAEVRGIRALLSNF